MTKPAELPLEETAGHLKLVKGQSGNAIIRHLEQPGAMAEMMKGAIANTTAKKMREAWRAAMAVVVFAYYTAMTDQKRSIMTEARERMLCRRLEEGQDDIHALLYAVDGLASDDFAMGRSSRSEKIHASPELLFRTWGQVEKYASQKKGFHANTPHPLAVKHKLVNFDDLGRTDG